MTEISVEEVEAIIREIIAACENFDGDAAVEVCKKSDGKSCGGVALKPLFNAVCELAEDFEYDEAGRKAEEILEKVKGGAENG